MKTYEDYADENIVFICLTKEPVASRESVEAWVQRFKIPWAVGFDAGRTLLDLEVKAYPTTLVIGRDGQVAWHSFLGGSLDKAIRSAL